MGLAHKNPEFKVSLWNDHVYMCVEVYYTSELFFFLLNINLILVLGVNRIKQIIQT